MVYLLVCAHDRSVNRYTGLFFFDSSFRPVPLEQHFLGVKGKPGSPQSRTNLDNAAFDKVAELVKAGHQCMVFVHARKDTVKTAQMLREKAIEEGILDLIDPAAAEDTNGKLQGFKRDLGASRNREMKDLANSGFGIHHAGMLRSDRNISERMFEANVTKVGVAEDEICSHCPQGSRNRTRCRSSAVRQLSPGVSTCPHTPSSSRARKCTTRAKVPLSISAFSTFCRSSDVLVDRSTRIRVSAISARPTTRSIIMVKRDVSLSRRSKTQL
jgi:hypothetical protein